MRGLKVRTDTVRGTATAVLRSGGGDGDGDGDGDGGGGGGMEVAKPCGGVSHVARFHPRRSQSAARRDTSQ